MTEKILVSTLINETELLRSLALRRTNSFAFRVLSPVALAETALIRCGKFPVEKRMRLDEQRVFIGKSMQQVVIGESMQQVESYFSEALSFLDATNLTDALNGMRLRIAKNEAEPLHETLSQGKFKDKNEALLKVYNRYTELLREERRVDDIGLIRLALAQASELDAEILVLREFALSPLEEVLVSRLSGGRQRTVSIQELFGVQPSKALRADSFTEAYGAVNEVDQLIKDIYTQRVPLDKSVVVVTAPTIYGQLFYELAMEKGIPVTFGCGIPIGNTRPANLLTLWTKWSDAGFCGADALHDMVYSDSFDLTALTNLLNQGRKEEKGSVSLKRLIELAGGLRLGPDVQANEQRIAAWQETLSESSEDLQLAEALRRLGRELTLPCADFLKKYAFIRPHEIGGPLDRSGLCAILDVLDLARRFPDVFRPKDLIPIALDQLIGSEQAKPGRLHVTTVEGAFSVQRSHLYILGLSADLFPGKPQENALVLDSDWGLLPCHETAPTSRNRIERARDSLIVLNRLAASLGEKVHLYWSNYDLSALKNLNPSSTVYRFQRTFRKEVKRVGYFPSVYSDAYAISKRYLEGRKLPAPANCRASTPKMEMNPEEREWSPSAIDVWFTCKRRFLYQYILGLEDQNPDDPMMVVSAAEIGNLAHKLMEQMATAHLTRENFRRTSGEMFEACLKARPPMDQQAAEKEKKLFVQMMDAAWQHDPKRKILLSEEQMHGCCPCGLRLTGRPDRVELVGNGKTIVVDFKTGKKVMQKKDDPATCRQALIYAWLLRQNGIEVERCEYRYLLLLQNIECDAGSDKMGKLGEDLKLFHDGLAQCDFGMKDHYVKNYNNSACSYCPYVAVCRLDKTPEEKEDENERRQDG